MQSERLIDVHRIVFDVDELLTIFQLEGCIAELISIQVKKQIRICMFSAGALRASVVQWASFLACYFGRGRPYLR